jgi:ubiquinone/menaquinone biosynthesis C-methylase UbiE
MIAVAERRLAPKAQLQVADAEKLPFRDGSTNVVVCVGSPHHYPDPHAALAEMHRTTRPDPGRAARVMTARRAS